MVTLIAIVNVAIGLSGSIATGRLRKKKYSRLLTLGTAPLSTLADAALVVTVRVATIGEMRVRKGTAARGILTALENIVGCRDVAIGKENGRAKGRRSKCSRGRNVELRVLR